MKSYMQPFAALAATICVSTAALPTYADGTIDDYYFRYDFSGGTWNYTGNGVSNPINRDYGCLAVSGTNGQNSAAHPWGWGGFGNTALNNDWTLAMSLKSCDLEKGGIICLGSFWSSGGKEILICSSGTPGQLHIAAIKHSGNTADRAEITATYELSGLSDTTNSFHSLVAVHKKGSNATGVVTFFWDGVEKGSFDTSANSATVPFAAGFQFSGIYGGVTPSLASLGYSNTENNPDIAFQDVRFFTRAISADEAALYAGCYPAASAFVESIDNFLWRFDFSSGEKVYESNGSAAEPANNWVSNMKTPGPDGYGTASHYSGWSSGNFLDNNVLAGTDWTVAMSLRSCSIEKGVLFCFGALNYTSNSKQFVICGSETPGKLHLGVIQNTSGTKSLLTSYDLEDLGDTTNSFNSLVVAYKHSVSHIQLYWNGRPVKIDLNVAGKNFQSRIQFFSMLGGGVLGYEGVHCPEAAFYDVRFATNAWTAAESRLYAARFPARKAYVGDIDEFHFRHNFSSGRLAVEGTGFNDDRNHAMSGKGTAVEGPDGAGTAVFPDNNGYGGSSVVDGLARDWTLAMSVKPASYIDRGVMVALGSVYSKNQKGFAVSTSTNSGALFMSVPQNWGSEGKKIKDNVEISGLGDISNHFHTLVVTYSSTYKTDYNPVISGGSWVTGTFMFYWDGKYVGHMTTYTSCGIQFSNGMQYGSIYGGSPAGYTALTDVSCGVRFQDLRFYTNVWTAAEAALYAERYPVRRPLSENVTTWTDAQGDESFDTAANWTWGLLPESDQTAVVSSSSNVTVGVAGTYMLGAFRTEGGGAITLGGEGTIAATNVTVASGTAFAPGGRMSFPSLVLESGALFVPNEGLSVAQVASNGGSVKAPGAGYFTVTESISGPLYAVRGEASGRQAFIKVPTALEGAADAAIVPRRGRLRKTSADGYVYYDLSPAGLVIFVQ